MQNTSSSFSPPPPSVRLGSPSVLLGEAATAAPPLWRLLQSAARSLLAIEKGRSWRVVADAVEAPLRPGTHALLYAVLRNWWLGQLVHDSLLKKAHRMPERSGAVLRIAAVLLAAQRGLEGAHYDAHTVVHQAVEATRRDRRTRHVAGVINACLRRLLRDGDALLPPLLEDDSVRFNLPQWWLQRLQSDWQHDWQAIADWQRAPAPLTLRVNTVHVSLPDYLQALGDMGVSARVAGGVAVVLQQGGSVERLPGYRQGWFAVQDAAAQLAAPLLLESVFASVAQTGRGRPLQVLDACAAPGGKTAHLLAYAEQQGRAVEVLALDADAVRTERLRENLSRLGHTADVVVADAAEIASWYPAWRKRSGVGFFDAVLLDAPCSGSGVVRRHPDIPLLRRAADIGELAKRQKRLLDALWPFVRAGGTLLYCTCSLFASEGDEQVQAFLQNNSKAELLPSPGQLLGMKTGVQLREAAGMPHNVDCEHDAFYYALLRKSAACSFA